MDRADQGGGEKLFVDFSSARPGGERQLSAPAGKM
jgi:hypothetical protein